MDSPNKGTRVTIQVLTTRGRQKPAQLAVLFKFITIAVDGRPSKPSAAFVYVASRVHRRRNHGESVREGDIITHLPRRNYVRKNSIYGLRLSGACRCTRWKMHGNVWADRLATHDCVRVVHVGVVDGEDEVGDVFSLFHERERKRGPSLFLKTRDDAFTCTYTCGAKCFFINNDVN